jgi:AraC family transcriptional activator FtrA
MAPLEASIAIEVFALPRPDLEVDWWYDTAVVAERPGVPLAMCGGWTLTAERGLDALAAADTVVVPAWPTEPRADAGSAAAAAVRAAHARGARLVSICSGAFLLAAAGVLDGLTVATHWRYAARLQERFPRLRVDPNVLYIDAGTVVTGAGSAAGIDACLHVVRRDHGVGVANVLARRLVVAPHRDGGQAQFIERPVGGADSDVLVRQAMDWALAHLAEPIRVDDLARRAFMSPRTFTRRFTAATGTSPLRWVVEQRVAASLALLEGTSHSVEHVGALVGFTQPATFRHHFARVMQTSPSAYRRAFRAGAAARSA